MTTIRRKVRRRAVSAIELVLVVIILGLLAALAIPRFSHAGEASVEAELRGRLTVLRTAIALYYRDHQAYPCASAPVDGEGADIDENSRFAHADSGDRLFADQLTKFTAKDGTVSETRTGPFALGPYLKKGVPNSPLTAPPENGRVLVVRGAAPPTFQPGFRQFAWVYNCDTGYIVANSDGKDASGKRFDQY